MTTRTVLAFSLLAAGACGRASDSRPTPPRTAQEMTVAEVRKTCSELEAFFRTFASDRTAAIRPGGELPWREYVSSTYLDSSAFFFNGTARKPVRYSTRALATPYSATDTLPDPLYEWRNVSVSVGIASEQEALYVMRFADLTSDYFSSKGRESPYISIQGGRVLRTSDGWRVLQSIDMSDRTGIGDSALVAGATAWECR